MLRKRDSKNKGKISWMQEGVACFERTCCVQGRFQVGLNYWRERESFEKKGANGFKQSVKICQINEIC